MNQWKNASVKHISSLPHFPTSNFSEINEISQITDAN